MIKISNFQIYSLLVIMVGPLAFLEVPKRMTTLLHNNAWLAALSSILPGILIILMFNYIVKKSTAPFPHLLEEYLGKWGGKILASIYVLVFLIIVSYTVSLFVNFVESNVLPATPISVLIAMLLLIGYVGIKVGLENFSKVSEIIVLIGLPFSFIIVLLSFTIGADFENILPFAYMSIKDYLLAVTSSASILGRLFPFLTIAFFSNDRIKVSSVMYKVLITYILLITLTTLMVILVFGGIGASILSFPAFSLVRSINLADFITNIDIVFVGIWILGIFGALTIPWFMACFTIQQVFNLTDYRFLAGPTALIIATTSLMMAANIIELTILTETIMVVIYLLFFILIPFILFIMALFKPSYS